MPSTKKQYNVVYCFKRIEVSHVAITNYLFLALSLKIILWYDSTIVLSGWLSNTDLTMSLYFQSHCKKQWGYGGWNRRQTRADRIDFYHALLVKVNNGARLTMNTGRSWTLQKLILLTNMVTMVAEYFKVSPGFGVTALFNAAGIVSVFDDVVF